MLGDQSDGDAPQQSLQAVLFDMDGLLIDSEPQWLAAETATVEQLGGVWGSQQNHDLHGTNLPVAADYMIRYTRSRLTRHEVMRLLSHHFAIELSRGVGFQRGAVELLEALAATEVRVGLVTSSIRVHAEVVLGHLPDRYFDVTVTADDVAMLKPHPMPYLTALESLQVAAGRTVVLEDSPPGVAAAEAAGCHVVAVPSVTVIEPAPRRTVVGSLADVDVGLLQGLITAS
jgi:HAD superfamily hydrolase (TIGR01509 family)